MPKMHRYDVAVQWTGNTGTGTSGNRQYKRDHEIVSDGTKPIIPGSSDPAFLGDPTRWNPEELLVAALSACHKLWYLHLAAESGIVMLDYTDSAHGEMEENPDGSGQFKWVMLRPRVTVASGSNLEKARDLHQKAHEKCFIARSVNFPVEHQVEVEKNLFPRPMNLPASSVLFSREARSGCRKAGPPRRNVMDLMNKSVLITGANRGIGRALVDEALRRGAKRVYAGTRSPMEHPDSRVTPLALDVTSASQIQRAVEQVDVLDVLINNAGVSVYDDLSDFAVIEQHLAVNFLGMLRVTEAFLPKLKRSSGAILNNLSLAGIAALPMIPAYSASKAAALNMTQSLRALLASDGVTVHAVVLGPVDTDMTRGLEIPKSSSETAAAGIIDGLTNGEEDIFPDPAAQSIAEGWRNGVAKGLERQFRAFAPQNVASAA